MMYLMNGVMTHLVTGTQARHSGSAMCLNSLACRLYHDVSDEWHAGRIMTHLMIDMQARR